MGGFRTMRTVREESSEPREGRSRRRNELVRAAQRRGGRLRLRSNRRDGERRESGVMRFECTQRHGLHALWRSAIGGPGCLLLRRRASP